MGARARDGSPSPRNRTHLARSTLEQPEQPEVAAWTRSSPAPCTLATTRGCAPPTGASGRPPARSGIARPTRHATSARAGQPASERASQQQQQRPLALAAPTTSSKPHPTPRPWLQRCVPACSRPGRVCVQQDGARSARPGWLRPRRRAFDRSPADGSCPRPPAHPSLAWPSLAGLLASPGSPVRHSQKTSDRGAFASACAASADPPARSGSRRRRSLVVLGARGLATTTSAGPSGFDLASCPRSNPG